MTAKETHAGGFDRWTSTESQASDAGGNSPPTYHTGDFLKSILPHSLYKHSIQCAGSSTDLDFTHINGDLFDLQIDEVADPAPGTCQWVFASSEYQKWRSETDNSQFALISAHGGLGKTVLTKAIKQHIAHKVIPFFCDSDLESRSSVTSVLASWICYLLVTHHSEITNVKAAALFPTPIGDDQGPPTVDFLWSKLLDICNLPFASGYTFLLDALDECPRTSQRELCNAIVNSRLDSNFRILITARPESPISSIGLPLIELSPQTLSGDLASFVGYEFARRGICSQVTPEFVELVQQRAIAEAGGLFLLVSCRVDRVLSHIDDDGFRTTPEHVENLMSDHFAPVVKYFGSMLQPLSRSCQTRLGTDILSLLLSSEEPLRVEDLAASIMCSQKTYQTIEAFIADKSQPSAFALEIRKLCGPFVQIDDTTATVSIIHKPARSFLTLGGRAAPYLSLKLVRCLGQISEIDGHVAMAKACLGFLCLPDLSPEIVKQSTVATSFLKYAIAYWPFHVRQCKERVVHLQGFLKKFFFESPQENPSFYRKWLFLKSFYDSGTVDTSASSLPIAVALVQNDLSNVLNIISKINTAGIVSLLGYSINLNESWGTTGSALAVTLLDRKMDLAFNLLHLGADPRVEDSSGRSALHLAASMGNLPFLQKFVELRTGLGRNRPLAHLAREDELRTLLFYTTFWQSSDHMACFEFLAERCDVSLARTSNGDSILHYAASNGCISAIEYLLSQNLISVNLANNHGETALHLAVMSNNALEAVQTLLAYQANAYYADLEGVTPLGKSINESVTDVALLLLGGFRFIDQPIDQRHNDWENWTALHLAASRGNARVVAELLLRGAMIDICTLQNEDALSLAVSGGHYHVVEMLIKKGAPINNLQMGEESSLLVRAAAGGWLDIVRLLIEAGAEDYRHKSGMTAMHMAAWEGHVEVVKCLISYRGKNSVNAVHKSTGYTPLIASLEKKNFEISRLLLEAGACVNKFTSSNMTPLYYCCGKVFDADIFDSVFDRTTKNLIDAKTDNGDTALIIAAQNGLTYAIRRLLEAGADQRIANSEGVTALMVGARSRSAETLRLLLRHPHSSPDRRNDAGFTALHYACESLQDPDSFRELCRKTNWKLRERSELPPLNTTIYYQNKTAFKILLSEGVSANSTSSYGETCISEAVVLEDPEYFQTLQKYGADTEQLTVYNAPNLVLALHFRVPEILEALRPSQPTTLSRRANTCGVNGAFEAAKYSLELLKWTIDVGGASPFQRSELGHNILHVAAEGGNTDLLQYLLKIPGMAPLVNEHSDIGGQTPLMIAVCMRNAETIHMLLKQGADVTRVDFFGFSAFHYAQNHAPTLSILKSQGAGHSKPDQSVDISHRIGSFVYWINSMDSKRAFTQHLRYTALCILAPALLYVGDRANSITCCDYLYGLPDPSRKETIDCDICRRPRRTHGFKCTSCPYAMFCSACREDEEKMETFGCATHELLKVPSDGWESRGHEEVNNKGQNIDEWMTKLASKYVKPCISPVLNYPPSRCDVFELCRSRQWKAFSDHLLKFPRDIWKLDRNGDSMVMQTIEGASADQECLETLKRLEFAGAVMLDRNKLGESPVQWACRKGFEQSATFLLNRYNYDFSKRMLSDLDGKNYEANEAMSIMCERKWKGALTLAIERHFKWSSYGRFEILQKPEFDHLSSKELASLLCKNMDHAKASRMSTGCMGLLKPFRRVSSDSGSDRSNYSQPFSKADEAFGEKQYSDPREPLLLEPPRKRRFTTVIRTISHLCG